MTTATSPVVAGPDGNAAAPPTRVSRSRQCVGTPPRQADDPMSPPCVATIFEGDNGGTTSMGVSATEIRVAVPICCEGVFEDSVNALFEYFNERYEFYGRRLVPVYVVGEAGSPLQARAQAAEAASQNIFGALTNVAEWSYSHVALQAEPARLGVVTMVRGGPTWLEDRTLFDARHPYVWSVYPSSEDTQRNMGDFACTALAGHLASHAGDAALQSQERRFGVISAGSVASPSIDVLVNTLTACTGVEPLHFTVTGGQGSVTLQTGMARLQAGGATTVICVCARGTTPQSVESANTAGYHPEWLFPVTDYSNGSDEDWVQYSRARGQMAPPMRMSAGPHLLPIQARPWFGPLQQVIEAPDADVRLLLGMGEFVYPGLLALAAGIQGAGPTLTPDSFAAALMTMQFPNPGAGQAPYWQPSAGFGPGDHSLYDSYDVAWWSDTADALDTGASSRPKGSWCYLEQGARYGVGSYPANASDRLFSASEPCR